MMKTQMLILRQDGYNRGNVLHLCLEWHVSWAKGKTEDQLYKYREITEKKPIPGMSSRFGRVAQSTCVYGSGTCAWTVREGPNQDDFASHIRARSDWEFSKQSPSSSVKDLLDRSQSGG